MTDVWLPAEWSGNQACWLAWPSDADEWLGDLHPPRLAVVAMAAAVADVGSRPESGQPRGETIHLLVPDGEGERSARDYLGDTPAHIHQVPFGDIWMRDTGPVFRIVDGALSAACYAWNGWGGKYLFPDDVDLSVRIAAAAGVACERFEYVLEGGAIDCDGRGTVLTTRQCLLADNRQLDGRSVTEADIEARLRASLGIRHTIWLDTGLCNDHTDGHVDTLARFVGPGRVVCMRASGEDDPNRAVLDAVVRTLRAARDADGQALEVVEIPSPGRVLGRAEVDGDVRLDVLPCSYVNFYIGNSTVVVPTYGSANDEAAVAAIAALFPGRRTVGIDALGLIIGGGGFHCISKQQPRLDVREANIHGVDGAGGAQTERSS